MIAAAFDSIDMVRLVSSGTEATMSAIRLARAAAGCDLIVKFAGCYHGHVDSLLVQAGSGLTTFAVPSSPGVPAALTSKTLVAPYNDLDAMRQIFAAHGSQIAAIIIEPVAGNIGLVPPAEGYLAGLRRLCDEYESLLIFDEVITGFRLALGGAQQVYGVKPDLTCLGKIIGGGLPVGAYGGRRDLMEMISPVGPVYQAGTLSGNPLAVAAGIADARGPAGAGRLPGPGTQRRRPGRGPGRGRRQGRRARHDQPPRQRPDGLLHAGPRDRLRLGPQERHRRLRPLLPRHAQGRRLPAALAVRVLVRQPRPHRRADRADDRGRGRGRSRTSPTDQGNHVMNNELPALLESLADRFCREAGLSMSS